MGDESVLDAWRESLASGDELHSLELPDGAWWACSFPERPVDDDTCFDFRCRGCYLMAEAAVRVDPKATTFATEWDGTQTGEVTTATFVRIARVFHGAD